jgi:hypothetical protein
MLVQSVEVLIVPQIVMPYTFSIANAKRKLYYKNYSINVSVNLTKEQLIPHQEIKTSTVILKQNGRYYWCPMYEEIYKTLKSTRTKESFKRNLFLRTLKDGVLFNFSFRKKEYTTYEVKVLKVIK